MSFYPYLQCNSPSQQYIEKNNTGIQGLRRVSKIPRGSMYGTGENLSKYRHINHTIHSMVLLRPRALQHIFVRAMAEYNREVTKLLSSLTYCAEDACSVVVQDR